MKTPIVIRYWGRKAGTIAEPYVQQFTRPGDLILDPFGGAGSIVKRALKLKRRAAYVDANPLAALIARVEIEGVDMMELAKISSQLLENKTTNLEDRNKKRHWTDYRNLYRLRCTCGAEVDVVYYVWNNDTLVAAKTRCNCGNQLVEINRNNCPRANTLCDLPESKLFYENGRPFLKRRQVDYVHQLFSQRNLLILSTLLHNIKSVETRGRIKRGLLVAFASILYQVSKMSRQQGGSWGINSYWIPRIHVERNPYMLFKKALSRLSRIQHLAHAVDVETVINRNGRLAILNADAKTLPLPDKSVDMIITDPPFTDEIQYFELSSLAAAWLGLHMPFDKEIIVNPKQGKTINDYYRSLHKAFTEMFRALKCERTAVIMVHDEDSRVLLDLIELIESVGFKCIKTMTQHMTQRQIGDRDQVRGRELLILTCKKP